MVTTDVGGNPEIIKSNFNGVLLSSGDYNALAEVIYSWVSKKPYQKMRDNCYTTARRFDITVLVNELESLFYEAVAYSSAK